MKEGSICNKCNHRAYCAMSDEHNNDNATIKGCYLYSEQKAKTNADCLRSMTDEELATWLNCMQSNAYHCGEFGRLNAAYPFDNKAWIGWLKQEATDGG